MTLDVLKQLFPVRNLEEDELNAFALDRVAEPCGPGSILFRAGEPSTALHYLLEGTVRMDVGIGSSYEVSADTAKARFPLCCAKEYSATAVAESEVQVLRVSPGIMHHQGSAPTTVIDPHAAEIPETVRENQLFQAFCQQYHEDDLHLPSLPEVAIKLKDAISSELSIREIAGIVQLDPGIAAKVVSVANSPLYLPARPIVSCQDAVTRLGISATRSLVTALCLRQVFQGKDAQIKKMLHEHWRQSVYLSALCYVLATDNAGVDSETALLAGLIADIGVVPFLHFADHFPRELWQPSDLEAAIPHLRGPVGTFLLKKWSFPAEFAEIPALAENWLYDGGEDLTVTDVVILSRLHAGIGTARAGQLPAINSVPACSKLKDRRLSPAYSLNVLHEAKETISQAMKLFEA